MDSQKLCGSAALSVLVVLLLVSLGVGSVGAQVTEDRTMAYPDDVDKNELHLLTSADGSTDLVLVFKYSLADEAESDGFAEAQSSSTLQDRIVADFQGGVTNMANNTESTDASDVHSGYVDMYTYESSGSEVGVAEVGVTWDNLGSVSDGTLTLTEPYGSGSGVETTTPLIVTAPEGSVVSQASPTPTAETTTDRSVAWSSGTNLSGFEVTVPVGSDDTAQSTSDATGEPASEDSTPGFTPLTGLASIVVATTALVTLRVYRLE